MTIKALTNLIHGEAKQNGWWDEEPTFTDFISLCHSEISEALEEFRKGRKPNGVYYENIMREKPEGVPVELGDCIMRILDYCGHLDIDITPIILKKIEYNRTRGKKNGGKVI